MINESKLKKWLEDNVIGSCNYGTKWKNIMKKELNDAILGADE